MWKIHKIIGINTCAVRSHKRNTFIKSGVCACATAIWIYAFTKATSNFMLSFSHFHLLHGGAIPHRWLELWWLNIEWLATSNARIIFKRTSTAIITTTTIKSKAKISTAPHDYHFHTVSSTVKKGHTRLHFFAVHIEIFAQKIPLKSTSTMRVIPSKQIHFNLLVYCSMRTAMYDAPFNLVHPFCA